MQQAFALLTAGALLWHALFGCCTHTARACEDCTHRSQARATAKGCCKHCRPPAPEQHQHGSDAPCKCRGECHDTCSYLPPQKSQVDHDQSALSLDFIVVQTIVEPADDSARLHSSAVPPRAQSGPARLHLLHQVMLI